MKKLSQIFLGWFFWITNRNNELAQKRLKICAGCDQRKWFMCGNCFCPLQAKARSNDHCPLYKWPGDHVQMDTERYNFIDGGFTNR